MSTLVSSTSYNLCVLCGKERVVVKEWLVEEPNGTKTKKSLTECPDDTCQSAVNDMLEEKNKERARKETARQARLAKIHAKQLEIVASM
ncbi:MAG: hypothetical protein M3P33_01780 [bacterium]|nr:hypothetical protein [bacterium]